MNKIKEILNMLPAGAWVALALVFLVGVYWFSDDLGNWWENRKQAQFDKRIQAQQKEIDLLINARNEAIVRAEEAEAREQSKSLEVELLREEIKKKGLNIDEAQKAIDEAVNQYQKDTEFINKVKNGEVSNLELCQKQCEDSKLLGYPCRPNYCDKFKNE